jgi:glutamate-5-semialdehyde dehydrogenase
MNRHVATPADKARLSADMRAMGRAAREASHVLALMSAAQKAEALKAAAQAVRAQVSAILEANALDCAEAKAEGQSESFLDRLLLTPARIEGIAASIEDIAALPDPVGAVMEEWTRPNGLRISRVRTPLGVIGVIFESRGDPAHGFGRAALGDGAPWRDGGRAGGGGCAESRDPAGAGGGPRGRGADAHRAGRHD